MVLLGSRFLPAEITNRQLDEETEGERGVYSLRFLDWKHTHTVHEVGEKEKQNAVFHSLWN